MVETPLYHFYHLYCGKDINGQEDSWKESIGLHIKALKEYELVNYIKDIKIGLVGEDYERQKAKDFLIQQEISFDIIAEELYGYEQVTQNILYNFSQFNNGYILYGHSKGSFNFTDQNRSWCKSMIYFNVVKWKEAIEYLHNVDAVGCDWHDFTNQSAAHLGGPHTGQRWFAGTYWWSKLERIKDIGHGPTLQSRWDAEVWIGQIPNISVYNITRSDGPTPNWITEW